jgi:enoyl-CoA hydratase/carnithine racemase
VLFDIDGPIASLTFNRPEARNAMTWEMYEGLVDACDHVDADDNVRVFVLRGAGGKAFVSGTDISQFTGFSTRDDVVGYEARLDAVIARLERVRAATIAQIEGVAAGGGCVIAIACDLRVCTPESKLGVPIARTLGNCLSAANYSRLLDLVGPGRVKDLLFTGRLIDGREAFEIGLVNRVVASASIAGTVHELAELIAGNAPLTVRATKEALRRIQTSRRLDPGEIEDLITMCYLSDDFKQAVQAFLGKTTPVFKGR